MIPWNATPGQRISVLVACPSPIQPADTLTVFAGRRHLVVGVATPVRVIERKGLKSSHRRCSSGRKTPTLFCPRPAPDGLGPGGRYAFSRSIGRYSLCTLQLLLAVAIGDGAHEAAHWSMDTLYGHTTVIDWRAGFVSAHDAIGQLIARDTLPPTEAILTTLAGPAMTAPAGGRLHRAVQPTDGIVPALLDGDHERRLPIQHLHRWSQLR